MSTYKIAFFDAKDYDQNTFVKSSEDREFEITYYETRLTDLYNKQGLVSTFSVPFQ